MKKTPGYIYYALGILISGGAYILLKDSIDISLSVLWSLITLWLIYRATVEFIDYRNCYKEE